MIPRSRSAARKMLSKVGVDEDEGMSGKKKALRLFS